MTHKNSRQSPIERSIQQERESAIYVSSISAWEVALLVAKGRLQLTMDVEDWMARSEALPFLNFIPVDNRDCCPIYHSSWNAPQRPG